ncbi:hypothetical protein CYMTET_56467 [Cymbomonas tetramitiformis]|uniref:Kinesin motor domain-containing protein n=1 Tax=Cymbomonas tetramitiformis TaxID=36881 RepID=A0AAE0EMA5_9CHLO|nr:hypothetical protein CYMTET_56467 [Cymbomonas tetramitiformis]
MALGDTDRSIQRELELRRAWEEERQSLQHQLEQERGELQKKNEALAHASTVSKNLQRELDELNDELDLTRPPGSEERKTIGELMRLQRDVDVLRTQLAGEKAEAALWISEMQFKCETMLNSHANSASKLKKYDVLREQNRLMYNQLQELRGNIRVLCRLRPPREGEPVAVVTAEGEDNMDQVEVLDRLGHWKTFTFDRVLTADHTQQSVYDELAPLIRSVMDGYCVCIFAYGQTSSGKTYTMSGPQDHAVTEGNRGLQSRALDDLFRLAEERRDEYKFTVQVQMLEIYNENIRDLLEHRSAAPTKADIRFVDGVPNTVKVEVTSTSDVVEVMADGERNRAVGATLMNLHSSRSHSVVTIMVDAENKMTETFTRAKLQLVDLAGSERLAQSQATGDRLKEAQNINRSLSALGDVVSALQNKSTHVPYRNSRLTTVLQDSLSGASKMVMLMHVSPETTSQQETISTLNFGVRAATVERSAPVKMNVSGPMNTNQVRKMMDELALRTKELEEKDKELSEVKANYAGMDETKKQVDKQISELNKLRGENDKLRDKNKQLFTDVKGSQDKQQIETVALENMTHENIKLKKRMKEIETKLAAAEGRPADLSKSTSGRLTSGTSSPSRMGSSTSAARRTVVGPAASVDKPAWDSSSTSQKALGSSKKSDRPLSASRVPTVVGPRGFGSSTASHTIAQKPSTSATKTPSTSFGSSSSTARTPAVERKPVTRPATAPAKSTGATRAKSAPAPTRPTSSRIGSKTDAASRSKGTAFGSRTTTTRVASTPQGSSKLTTPSSTSKSTSSSARSTSAGPPRVAQSMSRKPATGSDVAAKTDAAEKRKTIHSARVTTEAQAYSEEQAKATAEAAAERRREQEDKDRKAKLKKLAQKESKIKSITDFETLLAEAENQLARLAGGEEKSEHGQGGEQGDEISTSAVADICRKIDKIEEDAQSSGALDGKNEKERLRFITLLERQAGQLQADDIVSTDTHPCPLAGLPQASEQAQALF